MRNLFKLWRRSKAEDGNASVEFVIVVPVFLLLFVSIFELGMATIRTTMLEHGMDKTMRDIRLSSGEAITHDQIRDRICDRAGLLKDCHNALLVEMVRIDRDTFALPPVRATCIDQSPGAALPVTTITNGAASDLMFIRACFVVDPLYPTFGLGAMLKKDPAGNMQIVASSIFAQEPE